MSVVKKKTAKTHKPPADTYNRESKTILWRMECRDILRWVCNSDANILRQMTLRVVSGPAMADARRHYASEKLGVDQVMSWPDKLYAGTKHASEKDYRAALLKHRDEYHEKLLTKELHDEVVRLWELNIKWRDELSKRASEDRPLHGEELANWIMSKPSVLYELSQAGVLPVSP